MGRVGRAPGGESIGVLNLDSAAPAEALDRIRQHAQIHEISPVVIAPAQEAIDWLGSGP